MKLKLLRIEFLRNLIHFRLKKNQKIGYSKMRENELNSKGRRFIYIITLSTLLAFIVAYICSINLGYDPIAMCFFLGFLYLVIVLSLFTGE